MSQRSSRSGQKRAAEVDASTVGAESAAAGSVKRSRRASGAAVSLAEPGNNPFDTETPEEKKRQFFSQYHTELLRAWILDYPEWAQKVPTARAANRESLLTALVLHTDRPAAKTKAAQLAEMQKCWAKTHKSKVEKSPGYAVPPDADFPAIASSPAPKVRGAPPALGAAAAAAAAALENSSEEEDEKMGDEYESEEEQDPATPARAALVVLDAAGSGSSAEQVHLPADGCWTCIAVPPASATNTRQQWLCVCGRRGDLPTAHPTSKELMRSKLAGGLSSPSTTSASEGTATRAETAAEKLSKLDNHFVQLGTQLGSAHPLFAKTLAAMSPEQALKTARKALGSSKTQRPSQQLITLIQSGKLLNVAFAFPRPLAVVDGKAETVSGLTIDFQSGKHSATTASDPTKPAPLASATDLCMALFSTILPALIDRPTAMMEWITLGRTALQLSTSDGWPFASKYADALLQERISVEEKVGMAAPSDEVLRDIRTELGRPTFFQAGGAGRPAAAAKSGQGPCHMFNRTGSCQRGAHCRFEHICSNPSCGQRHAASSVDSCRAFIPTQFAAATPGTGGRRKPGGARSVASASGSVVTAKPAAPLNE